MRWTLDTNIVIGVMENRPASLRARVAGQRPADIVMSSIVMHELMFGAWKSARIDENLARLARLAFPVVDFDANDAGAAGRVRADLQRKGTPIGPYDVLIAGQALARDLTLVTANTGEFGRVAGLRLENWLEG